MDLALSWLAFPLVFATLCLGAGLALEALSGARIPGALVPAVGLAAVIVVGQFLTLASATAGLATSVVVAAAAVGIALALWRGRRLRPAPAASAGAVAVLAVYAAPIVLSGEATIAGYIKLDDTATWLAFSDQIMSDGRDLDRLAPSTYEATLAVNLGQGYPVGAFVPLGIGADLLGEDPAWLIQPYMALAAVLLALAAWSLAAPFVSSVWARAGIALVAAQPALLYGYYLWGGLKELLAAALVATAAALVPGSVSDPGDRRRLLPLAAVSAALIGVLSGGGGVWLAPILAVAAVLLAASLRRRQLIARAAGFVAGVALLALPVLLPGGFLPPTSSPLTADGARGNLFAPLDPLQVGGIWPAGDFRLAPDAEPLTYALAALALSLAGLGAWWAWRRRAVAALALVGGAAVGCLVLYVGGSPWVDAKALATASPVVLLLALVGTLVVGRASPIAAAIAAGLIVAGVAWSNALAYREVSLAPRAQLEELRKLGAEIDGEGPTLITEYSPYGARHFLRAGDPEAVSELRRRAIPLAGGASVRKGFGADTDALDPAALAVYRTLVLRRSPAQSRPPGAYELVWRGDFYEAWQRPATGRHRAPRLRLGSSFDPTAEPRCSAVRALAGRAGRLVAAARADPLVVALDEDRSRGSRRPVHLRGAALPAGAGTLDATARVREPGSYEVWVRGSVRAEASAVVDGELVGAVRHELNNFGGYISFGAVVLRPGLRRVELRFSGAGLESGSGGTGPPVGPIVLSRGEAADSRLVSVPAAAFRRLCGRQWDWIEAAS